MASNYDDLDEFVETDELTMQFTKAANHLQKLVATLDNNTLLELYGLYKQGLEGPCNTSRPSWYDVRGKSKWDAWQKLGDMSQVEAKTKYIDLIQTIDLDFGSSEETVGKKDSWVKVSTTQSEDDHKDNFDKNIKDFIIEGNVQEVNDLLLKIKLNINDLDEDGMGYLHWATDRGYVSLLDVLVKNGADVNLVDGTGQTALHYASSCDHLDCVKFLLENGCNPAIQDEDHSLAVDLASNEEIKKLLSQSS